MRVDKLEFCMRVFSTLVSWSNENQSCMIVDKREFACEFSQHFYPRQTRARVACMRLDESSQATVCMRVFTTLLSRQTRTRVA